MTHRTLVDRLCACAAALAALLALPGVAAADTSSASSDTTSAPTAVTGGTSVTLPTATVDPPVLVVGGAITVRTRPAAYLGDVLNFHGTAAPGDAGATVVIETLASGGDAWTTLATATVERGGTFLARWRTNVIGHVTVRAVISSTAAAARAGQRMAPESSEVGEVAVYQPAVATYFGPGLYGSQTACGETLTPALVGVANRTLPCGTPVEVDYDGRTLVVPVVDRGPYANGADWDLTAATAEALGMTETETVGTIVDPSSPTTPDTSSPASPVTAAYEQTTGGVAG